MLTIQFIEEVRDVNVTYTKSIRCKCIYGVCLTMYEKGISNTDNTFHDKIFDAISHGDADTAHKLVADILADALSLINSRL